MTKTEAAPLLGKGRVVWNRHPRNRQILGYFYFVRELGLAGLRVEFEDGCDKESLDLVDLLNNATDQFLENEEGWELADPEKEKAILDEVRAEDEEMRAENEEEEW